MAFDALPSRETIDRTVAALKAKGIDVVFAETGADAASTVLSIIPEGAKIMNMTSMTLSALGLDTEINESGSYDSIRNELNSMDRKTQNEEMQMLGAAPPWVVGSVHAVTEDGVIMIASKTGSQLPAYAYGASRVVWVAGAQKIVADRDEGFKRIYEWCLPRETERALKAYGTGSGVNKILIINEEIVPGRLTLVLVNEVLGF
jgi:LUD domain